MVAQNKRTMQKEFYLLKDLGFPLKIFDEEERARSIVAMGRGLFSYERISYGEASLLKPAIRDYLARTRKQYLQ